MKLAQHISTLSLSFYLGNRLISSDSRLGININPSDVCLTPRATDLYSWQPVQGKEELLFSKIFAKGLSDHS